LSDETYIWRGERGDGKKDKERQEKKRGKVVLKRGERGRNFITREKKVVNRHKTKNCGTKETAISGVV